MIEKERGGLGVGKRVTRKQAAPPQHNYLNLSSNSSENVLHYIWALTISGWDASTVSAFQSLCSYCWISRSHWGCWYQQTLCGSGERTGWAERTTWGSWSSTHRTGRDSEGQLRLWGGRTQISIQRSAVCSSVWVHIHARTWPNTHTLRRHTKIVAKSLHYVAKSMKTPKESMWTSPNVLLPFSHKCISDVQHWWWWVKRSELIFTLDTFLKDPV